MADHNTSGLRLPPHATEAEKSVLGAVMLDKEAVVKIADIVSVGDFYTKAHNTIYEAVLSLYEENSPIDVLSLSTVLEDRKQIDGIGGSSYLAELVSSVTSASNISYYAKIVQKKSVLRKLISAAADISDLGYDEVRDIDELLDDAEQRLFGISQKSLKKDFTPISTILGEAFDRLDQLHKNKGELRGVPTGFTDLDKVLSGLQKSDLIILAARPSVGKTSLVLDIARQAATGYKVPVGIFSLEMSSDQLVDRMIAAEGNIDLWKLRTGNVTEGDFTKVSETMGVLSEAPIYIDDTSSANIMTMRTMARRLQAEHELGLIIIDYLQLMEGRGQENRVQEISEISRGLKTLAKELNVPIVALSQLSRAIESRPDQRPRLSDLRESGSIEQDADVVMFIHREHRVNPTDENRNAAEIIVAKHRNGPVGSVQMYWHEEAASYKNLEHVHVEGPVEARPEA